MSADRTQKNPLALNPETARFGVQTGRSEPDSGSFWGSGLRSDGQWRLYFPKVSQVTFASRSVSCSLESTSGTYACVYTFVSDSCYPNCCDRCRMRLYHMGYTSFRWYENRVALSSAFRLGYGPLGLSTNQGLLHPAVSAPATFASILMGLSVLVLALRQLLLGLACLNPLMHQL